MIERILNLIKSRGITAKELTTKLELSNSAITDWKKGKAKPSTEAIIKLAVYFNVTSDYLLGLSDVTTSTTEVVSDKNIVTEYSKIIDEYSKLDFKGQNVVRFTIQTEQERMEHLGDNDKNGMFTSKKYS